MPLRSILTGALGAGLILLCACTQSREPIRVGANLWPGYAPLFLAQGLGHHEAIGIRTLTFPSTIEVMRAYRNRAIDVAAVTADEALLLAETDPDQRILLVCDYSNGADMLMAGPGIADLPALKGRRVGIESGALGAYMLARALDAAGLGARDVEVVADDLRGLVQAFKDGRIDAVVAYEPYSSELAAAGAVVVFDSRSIPGEIVDVLVTRQSLIDERPEAIRALIDSWFDALAYLRANPVAGGRLVSEQTRLQPDLFPGIFDRMHLLDRVENARLFTASGGGLTDSLRRIQAVMLGHQLLRKEVDLSRLVDSAFLWDAASGAGSQTRP